MVCLDSEAGTQIVARAEIPVTTIVTPAIAESPSATADWTVEIVAERQSGTEFRLVGPDERQLTTTVPVIGRHMAANAGLAIVMLLEGGYAWDELVRVLDGRRIDAHLPGRTQRVSGDRGPAVYVDFGHSPMRSRRPWPPCGASPPGPSSWSSGPTAIATRPSGTTWVPLPSSAATS